MKKIKLLTSIAGLSALSMGLIPAIASCSKTSYNEPELSAKTSKTKEVAANSTRIYFIIEQKNIKEPEATKVKLTNLVVNGASVSSVAGIIKSSVDSAGNILVTFNMSIVQRQYQAESITFDLLLTNKKANTEYTLTGFEVKVVDTASSVSYTTDAGVTLKQAPTSVQSGENLEISFDLSADKYEYSNSECDVLVNGKSIKNESGVTFDLTNGAIVVPASLIEESSEIEIVLVTQKSLPLTAEYYTIEDYISGEGLAVVRGFSDAVKADPTLVSEFDTFKFGNYSTATCVRIAVDAFASLTGFDNLKNVKCVNNASCSVDFSDNAFIDANILYADFGDNEVTVGGEAFGCSAGNAKLEKIIISPKTTLEITSGVSTQSPFYRQTKLSTIDASKFTTETEITNVVWQNYNDTKIFGDSSHSTTGTILISDESLIPAWTTKFANAGLTVDGTNWKFAIK